ncbi:MAG: metalloregulator ArsR/SmtB family transcription factor [Chloroflexi bacterium]|nr:metalloregulator ArsR/SmtB family transcription factor [Chloroflexota bacterium]MBU1748307.1 metalloregulator ArsR/SmtB family transcription factor [Chloroflexota bacterium]MBU1878891.1 metalloregulator ArsR/SmtB family transcription factor [Chloroflexota bacterium]
MPPLQIMEALPPPQERIRFRTSPVYEMMISLHVLRYPDEYPASADWVQRVRQGLTPDQTDALEFFYTRFYGGMGLAEIAEGYADHDDVDGFLRYVEALGDAEFLWYPLGRVNPLAEVAAVLAGQDTLANLIARNDYITAEQMPEFEPLFADPAGSRERLLALWRSYWQAIFAAECARYRAGWEQSITAAQARLSQTDVEVFLEDLGVCSSSRQFLVDNDMPEIWLVPSYFRDTRPLSFYSDDRMTILYDARTYARRHVMSERMLNEALTVSKALNDGTRLRLLGHIYRDEHNGTVAELAEVLGISQPTVSRHLRILREAGVLSEQRVGNRVYHTVNLDRIASLSDSLLSFLQE